MADIILLYRSCFATDGGRVFGAGLSLLRFRAARDVSETPALAGDGGR
jgi:hypothetical protein